MARFVDFRTELRPIAGPAGLGQEEEGPMLLDGYVSERPISGSIGVCWSACFIVSACVDAWTGIVSTASLEVKSASPARSLMLFQSCPDRLLPSAKASSVMLASVVTGVYIEASLTQRSQPQQYAWAEVKDVFGDQVEPVSSCVVSCF